MSQVMVFNAPQYMCGCEVASGCKCKQPSLPQPQPLGLPSYNFNDGQDVEEEQEEPTVFVNNGGNLPELDWDALFNADAAKRKAEREESAVKVENNDANASGHKPLGIPAWTW